MGNPLRNPVAFALAVCLAVGLSPGVSAADPDGLARFLPDADEWRPAGPPRMAADAETLFVLINGGAERYVRLGFRSAVFQNYKTESGRRYAVMITGMADPGAAREIHRLKADGGESADIGDEGKIMDYYLIFRKGRFCVTLTAHDVGSPDLDAIRRKAHQIEHKMDERNPMDDKKEMKEETP